MDVGSFLTDINTSEINKETTRTSCINKAAESFNREFGKILDKHAPLRVIQKRINYCPALKEDTKKDIYCRNSLRNKISNVASSEAINQYKALINHVKNKIKADKKEHNELRIINCDTPEAWRVAKNILGIQRNKDPFEERRSRF